MGTARSVGIGARRGAVALAAMVGVCGGAAALGQPGPGGGAGAQPETVTTTISNRAPDRTPWPAVTIEEAMGQATPIDAAFEARLLERVALIDLRLQPAPGVEDFRFAELALEAAAVARGDDAGVWRRVVEAAFNAGDPEGVERATRRVLLLDPSDTVAQLRLISMRLGKLQTREQRLAAYDRLLGPAGASLDASVRSRLALDAAVLAREGGDTDGFARLLTLSTSLDSSHKEAAALALAYFQAAVPDDPVGRMQLLCNLLLADPLDPHVHLAVSGELASHGAYLQAARFHNNARYVIGASDPRMAEALDLRGLVLIWLLQGPEPVVAELNGRLATRRHEAEFTVRQKEQRGMVIRDEERPEFTRLDREYELLRLLAADAAGLREVASESAADLTATAMAVVQYYRRPENLPVGDEGQRIARQIVDMWLETLVARAWAGSDIEAMGRDLETTRAEMAGSIDLEEPVAWHALRTGNVALALRYFERTERELYRSRLGLALALEGEGRREDAAALMASISREDPLSVPSAWARSRLLFMTGQDLARTEHAEEVAAIADSVPVAIDRMLLEAQEFMRLRVSAPASRVGPLEIGEVEILLANRSRLALGVGGDRPIASRFLLSPEVRIGGTPVIGGVQPEVFDADTRLRLAPGESVTMRIWPENGFTGFFEDAQAASRTGLRWRAIQGFRIKDSAFVRGPLCLSDSTPEVYREPLLMARLSVEDLERAIREAPEDRLAALARATFAVCLSENYGRTTGPEQAAALGLAMRERYEAAGPRTRALLLELLPHGALAPGFAVFDDGVRAGIAAETDPTVLLLALITRAQSPDDPIVVACRGSAEPGLSEMAEIRATRLDPDDPRVYSRVGPGLGSLMGPVIPSLRGVQQ